MVTLALKGMAQNCLWENTDLPGGDIESRNLTHWLDCVVACDENSDCATWTYSQHGNCSLKSRPFDISCSFNVKLCTDFLICFCSDGENPIRQDKGWLEVFNKGEWRPICDDGWTKQNSMVVCQELGYISEGAVMQRRTANTGDFWMDDVKCTGSESKISQCKHLGWGIENCGSSEALRVVCPGGSECICDILLD